ncbi:MAG: ATP-binding protein [Coriobacteriia bacterium]|nr:ATP-binding protein [Coriobacteriia bacterium]
MPDRRDRTARRWRVLPPRLSTRLTLTTVVTAIVVFALFGTAVSIAFAYHVRAMTRSDQLNHLSEVEFVLELKARELDSHLMGFTEWQEFYDRTVAPDPSFAADELDPWLPERAGATGIVWQRSDGVVLHERGNAADIEQLLSVAEHGDAAGLLLMPSGPAIVAVRRIIGSPEGDPVGILAIARPVDPADLPATVLETETNSAEPKPLLSASGWTELSAPRGYSAAVADLRGGRMVTRGTLSGIDGKKALVVEISQPDPWLGEGRAWVVVVVPIALGLSTAAAGLVLGAVLSRSIGVPLARFVAYMRDQGYYALQGLPVSDELVLDPGLPDDFKELGQVIVDLMTQLRVNQAELIDAGEQALAAERAFRLVVEESPEVKILVREGVVEIANPAAAHFFGLHLGDLVRADPSGIFSGVTLTDEQGQAIDLSGVGTMAAAAPVVARCEMPDQPDRWVEISVATIDRLGRDYVISARNVTEERRLEALRQEILSLVSHDLRSPLTVVRGYLDILDRQFPAAGEHEAIAGAQRAARRMEGLLEDLLNATRAERAFAPTVMRTIDLGELVDTLVTSMRLSTEQELRVYVDHDVTVLGDAARLEQAVTNLVGNAIKHGGSYGAIDVRVFRRGERACVSVKDKGPGVEPALVEHVFDRGVRGPAADGLPGLGLGLYIVRIVAEAHGGSVTVEEHGRPGALFVMDLPLEHQATSG